MKMKKKSLHVIWKRPLSYRKMVMMKKTENITRAEEVKNPERTICGYTTKEHLILDLDKTHSLWATEKLVHMIQSEYPDVGDCLISQSSYDGYHCIFDNKISWQRIMHISQTLTSLDIVNRNFTKVRSFREDLTLRISSIDRGMEKSEAPKPVKYIVTYGSNFRDDDVVSLNEIHREACKFSGIFEYLTCLSAFRTIEPIPIR